jgi:acetylornithine/N-succinyldiaminopimelate aminotransferase
MSAATTVPAAAPAAPATPLLCEEELGLFAPVYGLPRLELVSGRGPWVKDAKGREYLDFVSGIGVNALGHAPSGVARAVSRQMKQLGHISNLFANRPALELARDLTRLTAYERVFFCNSGTEGMEAALKFARARARALKLPGTDLLAFRGGFHGRTGFALSTTWTPSYREPFEPLIPGVRFADYNDEAALDQAFDERVAAVVIEPVQGEGGAIPATAKFLAAVRARCSATRAALIFDEVQCGMGRTGRLLAAEHYGLRADYTVLSKALGGGLPLAAVLMTAEAAESLAPGMHGCTFGGGPVITSGASFVLSRIARPGFLARVRRSGERLATGLTRLVQRHPTLAEARGLGLLRAVEIAERTPYTPAALVAAARDHGLLLVRGGERAVRLIPPLDVKPAEIDEALERLDRALDSLESKAG